MPSDPAMNYRDAAAAAGLAPENGLRALRRNDAAGIEAKEGTKIVASVDIDRHFIRSEPNENRWDYGVGAETQNTEAAFWVEPHPASSTSEVAKMLAKLKWLKRKLDTAAWAELKHLTTRAQERGIAYRWLTTGSIRIRPGSREALMLSRAGLDQPRTRIRLP
jgi:hypothetical protein